MNRYIRPVVIAILLLVLAAGWIWRYVTMNRYYDDLDNGGYKLYQSTQTVPFENDGHGKDDLNGYFLRVNGYEVLDYRECIEKFNLSFSEGEDTPEKLALVRITLGNEFCEDGGINLTKFSLRSIDTVLNMDWDMLTAINSVLNGSRGIKLNKGSELDLVLPYGLYQESFRRRTWNNIDEQDMYFKVTTSLTTKEILISDGIA